VREGRARHAAIIVQIGCQGEHNGGVAWRGQLLKKVAFFPKMYK
jgi:hypothetical protein